MHHIFVKKDYVDLNNRIITISTLDDYDNYNHLVKSLRIKVGEKVLCSIIPFLSTYDYKTVVQDVSVDAIILSIEEEVSTSELPISINLYQGVCKADKLEFVIEKAVELGVNTITPFETEFCVAKIDKKDKRFAAKMERFNKISKAAAEQSKRHIIPEVLEPITIDSALAKVKNDYNIVFYENAMDIDYTRKVINDLKKEIYNTHDKDENVPVNSFVGPEGGFTEKEVNLMKEAGFHVLTLGKRVLRTETAAITALSILMYEFEK